MQMIRTSLIRFTSLIIPAALAVSACGGKSESPISTQIAAKVNKDEISLLQLDFETSLIEQDKVDSDTRKQVLDRLIDRQVIWQKAKELELDRLPNIMYQMERAKQLVLVKAYLDQVTRSANVPSSTDIKTFIRENSHLFGDRKEYEILQVSVDIKSSEALDFKSQVKKLNDFDKTVSWLQKSDPSITSSAKVFSSEQAPKQLMENLSKLPVGKIALYSDPKRVHLIKLVKKTDQAIPEEKWNAVASQLLTLKRRDEVIKNDVERLLSQASITFFAPFAKQQTHADKMLTSDIDTMNDESKSTDLGISGLR